MPATGASGSPGRHGATTTLTSAAQKIGSSQPRVVRVGERFAGHCRMKIVREQNQYYISWHLLTLCSDPIPGSKYRWLVTSTDPYDETAGSNLLLPEYAVDGDITGYTISDDLKFFSPKDSDLGVSSHLIGTL